MRPTPTVPTVLVVLATTGLFACGSDSSSDPEPPSTKTASTAASAAERVTGTKDERAIKRLVIAYNDATTKLPAGSAICNRLSGRLQSVILVEVKKVQSDAQSCGEAVSYLQTSEPGYFSKLKLSGLAVEKGEGIASGTDKAAKTDVRAELLFVKEGGRWLIDSLGID
ncbi:hypothetical protein [Patulibacter minatonensis]|uniref:hypothetical protein n=1 Tax=Patulibacter minatonensis TaxID=298163 RepID=UPI00055F0A97|nr:hypothetical protein [Patulibacter minatonensis]